MNSFKKVGSGSTPERDVAVVGPHERVAELQRRAVEGLAAVLGKPVEVQQLLEEHGDGARVPLGEGVDLPDARDEVGHRGYVGGVVAVLRGRGAEF